MNVFDELEHNTFVNHMLKKNGVHPFTKLDGYDVKVHGFYSRSEPRDHMIDKNYMSSLKNVEPAEDGGIVREDPHCMPEEVQGWNDILQESFCIHAQDYRQAGLDWEEADRLAIEDVKKSPDFLVYFKG